MRSLILTTGLVVICVAVFASSLFSNTHPHGVNHAVVGETASSGAVALTGPSVLSVERVPSADGGRSPEIQGETVVVAIYDRESNTSSLDENVVLVRSRHEHVSVGEFIDPDSLYNLSEDNGNLRIGEFIDPERGLR